MALCPVRSDIVFKQEGASRRTACTSTIAPLLLSLFLLGLIRSLWRPTFITTCPSSPSVGPSLALPRQR